jgi:carbamoyl-phosphate synthase small subunit
MKGILSTVDLDDASLVAKAQSSPGLVGRDLVKEVIGSEMRPWHDGLSHWWDLACGSCAEGDASPSGPHVVALDYGMKWNIARHLYNMGCRVTVVPGTATADEVLALEPDGVFLSNGPGDPRPLDYAIQTIRDLLGRVPIFGICLGHQLLGLACDAEIFKLKFGHRGANQPVLNLQQERVEITTQNHGFAIKMDNLPPALEPTHINLNDQTLEGLRHRDMPAFSVQYHPESSAGPHDSHYLFAEFRNMLHGSRSAGRVKGVTS